MVFKTTLVVFRSYRFEWHAPSSAYNITTWKSAPLYTATQNAPNLACYKFDKDRQILLIFDTHYFQIFKY